jgi:hypothetical protein
VSKTKNTLMRGLDPRIQSAVRLTLDGRVKPGHEEEERFDAVLELEEGPC